MAPRTRTISDTAIIPRSCRERFLPLDGPSARPLRERGVVLAGISDVKPPYEIARRGAPYHVILHTLAGGGRFLSEAAEGPLRPGTVWVGPAGVAHRYRSGPKWRIAWLHVGADSRWSDLQCRAPLAKAVPSLAALGGAMEGFISEAIQTGADAEKAALSYAEIIAIHLDRELGPHDDPASRRIALGLEELWRSVHADLGHPWTVAQLAASMHVSVVQLHRLVARFHKSTPMEIVVRMRMKRAEDLLLHTDYPLKLIADLVGYETPFAFSRAFKRHAGTSPKFFRKRRPSRAPR
jgi:AraC-like DNA-binding protein